MVCFNETWSLVGSKDALTPSRPANQSLSYAVRPTSDHFLTPPPRTFTGGPVLEKAGPGFFSSARQASDYSARTVSKLICMAKGADPTCEYPLQHHRFSRFVERLRNGIRDELAPLLHDSLLDSSCPAILCCCAQVRNTRRGMSS